MNNNSPQQRKFAIRTNSWILEISSCVFSAIALFVIVVLLAYYDGKPAFYFAGISLNTIVSLLSTLSKAGLILAVQESISQWKWISFSQRARPLIEFETLDSASRGPMGSLKLLWEIKGGRVVAIGAFAVIIGLLFDPFMQWIIGYTSQPWFEADGYTLVPRAQSYSKGARAFQKNSGFNFSSSSHDYIAVHADFEIQSAVLYGVSKSIEDVTQRLPFILCSTCNDLTGDLKMANTTGKGLYFQLNQDFVAPHDGPNYNLTAFTLPNGQWLDNLPGWNNSFDAFSPDVTTYLSNGPGGALMSTYGTGNASETNTFHDFDTLIWVMGTIRVPPQAVNASTVWPSYPVEAMECALYYCVNEYDSKVVNGSLQQNVTQIDSATRSPDSWIPDLAFFEITSEADNTSAVLPSGTVKSLQFSNPWSAIPRSDLMLGDNFNVSQDAVDSISNYFQTTFTTNETADLGTDRINGFLLNDSVVQFQPSVVHPLYFSPDINATFQALAASMSNAIRAGADGNTQVSGENGPNVTYVRVQWAWITLPLVVELLGVLCLILTIRESRSRDIAVLKSNSLAVLARGPLVSHALADAGSIRALNDASKEHWMHFHTHKGDPTDTSSMHMRQSYEPPPEDCESDEIPLRTIQRPESFT